MLRFDAVRPTTVGAASIKKTVFLVHSCTRLQDPVKAALLERGYHVVHAESVEAALQIWARLTVSIDLFLADISLGKDQGIEQLVKLLQAENPRMRVLFANELEAAAGPIVAQCYPMQLVTVVDNCLA
jgi:ActR/RegA family two-component response regulator